MKNQVKIVKVKDVIDYKDSQVETKVVKAKIKLVLIPESITNNYNAHGRLIDNEGNEYEVIVVSDSEICSEGEEYLSSIKRVVTIKQKGVIQVGDKILARHHQLSDKHTQALMSDKLRDNSEVYLECNKQHLMTGFCGEEYYDHFIKLNKSNHIKLFRILNYDSWDEIFSEMDTYFNNEHPTARVIGASINNVKTYLKSKFKSPELLK